MNDEETPFLMEEFTGLKYSLHLGEGSMTGCIKSFSENESIWDNVKSALLRRISWQRKTKYEPILKSIPEHFNFLWLSL